MKNINIKSVKLRSFKCFRDAEINLRNSKGEISQWTVLLGNNNTGKTNLLKAIADLRPKMLKSTNGDGVDELSYVPAAFYSRKNQIELDNAKDVTGVQSEITDDETENWEYLNGLWTIGNFSPEKKFLIFGYGVTRYPSSTSLSDTRSENCESLFNPDKRLVNIEEWLMQLDYASKNGKKEADQLLNSIRTIVCGQLFPEIQDFRFESTDEFHNFVMFKTADGWFRYTQLGFGYQSTLAWIIDLCKKMFDNYPTSENPLHEGAIVLIDEIDLHLHPKWQRDIIPYLSKAFPKIQFIVTTHSPLVVQSMEDVNLYILTRSEDKVTIEKSEVTNFVGWSVEEILRHTMRMSDDIYSDVYQRYYELFDEGLDTDDIAKMQEAYDMLSKIMHPNNPARRILELQIATFKK